MSFSQSTSHVAASGLKAQRVVLQGWRLDPLLLFCQLLTAGTALGFALEALGLRQQTQANPVRSICVTAPV